MGLGSEKEGFGISIGRREGRLMASNYFIGSQTRWSLLYHTLLATTKLFQNSIRLQQTRIRCLQALRSLETSWRSGMCLGGMIRLRLCRRVGSQLATCSGRMRGTRRGRRGRWILGMLAHSVGAQMEHHDPPYAYSLGLTPSPSSSKNLNSGVQIFQLASSSSPRTLRASSPRSASSRSTS